MLLSANSILEWCAVGDGVLAGDGIGREIDDGEIAGEETVGLELLTRDVERGSVRDRRGDSARDHHLGREGGGVRHSGGDVVVLEHALLQIGHARGVPPHSGPQLST